MVALGREVAALESHAIGYSFNMGASGCRERVASNRSGFLQQLLLWTA